MNRYAPNSIASKGYFEKIDGKVTNLKITAAFSCKKQKANLS